MRVGAEVRQAGHHQLAAAQPERVRSLQRRGVPQRRQPALAAPLPRLADALVGVVEQVLQLPLGQRPPPGLALELRGVHRSVPLETDLRRVRAEQPLAHRGPLIARVRSVLAEQAQITVIGPDRRPRPPLAPQLRGELPQIHRPPAPRPVAGEPLEPPHPLQPPPHRRLAEVAAQLLIPPARQHRLEHLLIRPQQPLPTQHQQPRRRSRHVPRPAHEPPLCQPTNRASDAGNLAEAQAGALATRRSRFDERPARARTVLSTRQIGQLIPHPRRVLASDATGHA